MAEWLEGVDLLDPEAVAAAARPVMAAMDNPNGLDRAKHCYDGWYDATESLCGIDQMPDPAWLNLKGRVEDALEAVGLDQMDGKDWRESATGVRA